MDPIGTPEMIAIPSGRVTLSDRRTQRTWAVDLAPYELAAAPVTQAQYEQVLGERPSTSVGGQLPVESMPWLDAVRFCNALSESGGLTPAYRVAGETAEWEQAADGYRLPTEAEWEHACRAGTTAARYGVLALPTVIVFSGGEAAETLTGARKRSDYERAAARWASCSRG